MPHHNWGMGGRERGGRLLAAVALLAVGAVGADLGRRALARHPDTPARGADSVASAGGTSAPAARPSSNAGAQRARVLALIADQASLTYLPETLLETDSTIRRWPDERFARPLKVCVLNQGVGGFREDFIANVNFALGRWNGVLPITLATGADSADADVVITWAPRLDSGKTGRTDLTWDPRGYIHHAFVVLATHDPGGRPLDGPRMSALALHELGHALGLGHSPQKSDALYPIATALELTDRDRATARLLYELPPGSLR